MLLHISVYRLASCTLHYTTLHYTTLHYTTLHYTTLHYTTLHYTTTPAGIRHKRMYAHTNIPTDRQTNRQTNRPVYSVVVAELLGPPISPLARNPPDTTRKGYLCSLVASASSLLLVCIVPGYVCIRTHKYTCTCICTCKHT